MAARKAPEAAVASEPAPTVPATGEVSTPDEGEVTTPPDVEQEAAGQAEGADAAEPDEAAERADGAEESGTPDAYDPAAHIARLLAEQAEEVDVTPTTVVMRIAITGTRDGEPWPRVGETVDLPADEAERFIQLGYAELSD